MKKVYKKKSTRLLMLAGLCLMAFLCAAVQGGRTKAADKDKTSVIKDAGDLKGKKIGVQIGTTADTFLSDKYKKDDSTTIEKYEKGADAIQSLKQKKIDAVVIDEQVAYNFAKKNPGLKVLSDHVTEEEYAGVVAKGNEKLLGQINDAISELKEDGTLDKIKDEYIKGTDYHYEHKKNSGKKLVMATSADFPPYEYMDNNDFKGIDIDFAYAIADKLGRKLEIQNISFDAIINAVSSGKADVGFSGFTVTEERKKAINFTDTYTSSNQLIIIRDPGKATVTKSSFKDKLYDNFVKESRWKFLATGLVNTLIIAALAVIIGIVLGFLIALVRVSHDKNGTLGVLDFLARLYLAVVRGTPMMVQLLIIYYVIFASVNVNKIFVAVVAFGLNSAAYQAEIIRSGIMSIDPGQFEAGKSLGLSFGRVMVSIILPQAFKNVLPALGNEFISLLKETSISGYIGLNDLTRGGDIIRSVTYEALIPLLSVAVIYLILVLGLSAAVSRLERRLKKNER